MIDVTRSKKKNIRVHVFSGDGETDLGLGTYEGTVEVFVFEMPDGSLKSMHDAASPPPPELCQQLESEGAVLRSITANPKIRLDTGDIVYGCQTWWGRVL